MKDSKVKVNVVDLTILHFLPPKNECGVQQTKCFHKRRVKPPEGREMEGHAVKPSWSGFEGERGNKWIRVFLSGAAML